MGLKKKFMNRELKNRRHPNQENFLNYILTQLADLEDFTFRKMFGGIGFYKEGLLFGAITGGKFRLKHSKCASKQAYEDCKASANSSFIPDGELFCEVPEGVLENKSLLKSWVEKAWWAAFAANRKAS